MKAIELFYLPVIYNNYSAHYFFEEKFSAFNPVLRHVDFPSHAAELEQQQQVYCNRVIPNYKQNFYSAVSHFQQKNIGNPHLA